MVEQHVAVMGRFLDLAEPFTFREKVLTNDQAHGALIYGLLNNGRGAKLDQVSADNLTEEYLDAIEDLPAWTVREALRKWNKGASVQLDKRPHNFEFRPAPPTLGRLAYFELWNVKSQIQELQTVLDAVPRIEFSDEHCTMMRNRLADVFRGATGHLAIGPPNPDQGKQPEWSKEPLDRPAYQEAGE